MEQTIDKFIDDLVEALTRENNSREHYSEKKELDIPFIISAIKQNIQKDDFKDFLNDLNKNKYCVEYEDYNDGWLGYGKIIICLYNEERDEFNNYNYTPVDYQYIFKLTSDQRHWHYCECTPEDNDYREDKDCCGHGCDWNAPAFILIKEISVSHEEPWKGDQHDYWDFEDNFYKSDKELSDEKAKRDRENKIKSLKEDIESMQKQLNELLKAQ